MHIGNLRVAILNFLVAQQNQENFIVRIDDIHKEKNIEGKDTEIMQILEKFALNHESVFHQSEHLHMQQTLAIKLLEQDKAFVCTCAKEDMGKTSHYSGHCYDTDKSDLAKLKASGTPFVIRIKEPGKNVIIDDLIQGTVTTAAKKIDSFIILQADGAVTDTFASACDDMLSGITTIISEDAQLLDTAREKYIKEQLGFDAQINYAHVPVVSSSDDDATLKWLFAQGFIPDAIINYLLLLNYEGAPHDVFTLPDAIKWYKLENISSLTTPFDLDKLRFINRQHLNNMGDKELSSLFGFADADIGKLAKLYLNECSTAQELNEKIKAIFEPKHFQGEYSQQMRALEKCIQDAPIFSSFSDFSSYLTQATGLKDNHLLKPLRFLLTSEGKGPELSDIYPLIKSYLLEIAS